MKKDLDNKTNKSNIKIPNPKNVIDAPVVDLKNEIKKGRKKNNKKDIVEIPKKSENDKEVEPESLGGAYKEFEFKRFCFWLCMPTMFKGKDMETLQEKFFIDDEDMVELCGLKTMQEFSMKYNVSPDTLTEWKKKAKGTDLFQYVQEWAKKVNKNVVASAYRSAMSKDPKAFQDRKLMLQLGGWSEEQTVNVKGEGLFDILKKGFNIQ